MESAEKQTQLSRSFHRPLGNLAKTARFPHSHNADEQFPLPKNQNQQRSLRTGRPVQLNSLRVGHFRWPKWARARGRTQAELEQFRTLFPEMIKEFMQCCSFFVVSFKVVFAVLVTTCILHSLRTLLLWRPGRYAVRQC